MNRQAGDWFLLVLLILYADRHLCAAEHHPYCQGSCAGFRVKAARINCLLRCDQDLTGVFYRGGRGVFPYLSIVPPPILTGDSLGDDLDDGLGDGASSFEVPVSDVLVREPRDRSAFVRIGKRDVSAVLGSPAAQQKRRDEFVRIGKSSNQANRGSPFIIGRPYTAQEESKAAGPAADEALLIPIADAIKRPSAFVRIGKRRNDDVSSSSDNDGSLSGAYSKNSAPQTDRTHQLNEGRRSSEGQAAGPDETELEKKASAFVRIGRRGAAFVRIGKYDPNSHTSD